MSNFDNLDVMLGNENNNPIERELADAIEQSPAHEDADTNMYHGDELREITYENDSPRQNEVRQSFEVFSKEFTLRLSHDMDLMMSRMHSKTNRAINTAIAERIIPEIQKYANSMSSSGHRGTEASMSPNSQENKDNASRPEIKIAKKDSRPFGDLRDTAGRGSYMVTGAIDTQQQIPEFLTGPIHSIPNLKRQQSNHNVSLDTTLPAPEPSEPKISQDPFNRLADVLVNLQNKPQFLTIRPVQTTPRTFDGKSEKFEIFEDLFHTVIKKQLVMTEQMKINHFHYYKVASQTFRNIIQTTAKL